MNKLLSSLNDDVSVIIVTYNHQKHITSCLESVIREDPGEVVVVDNGSRDRTTTIIEGSYPQVKLIKNSKNPGFGAANNIGVKNSKGKYLVFLNPDTKVESTAIKELVNPIKKDKNLVTSPKILLYHGEKINTCGNKQHITGMAFTRGAGDDPKEWNISQLVNGISGACFAMTQENFQKLGGFDENLFLYMEDSELSWRIKSHGLKILYVPGAVVRHDYDFSVTPEKIYHVERGRYIILRKYLNSADYLLLFPSLLMTEILTWGYAGLNGRKGLIYKAKGIKDGWSAPLEKMEVDRRSLLKGMDHEIPPLDFQFNPLFRAFRKMANFTYRENLRLL